MEGPATASQGSLSPSVKAVKGEGSIAQAITPDDTTEEEYTLDENVLAKVRRPSGHDGHHERVQKGKRQRRGCPPARSTPSPGVEGGENSTSSRDRTSNRATCRIYRTGSFVSSPLLRCAGDWAWPAASRTFSPELSFDGRPESAERLPSPLAQTIRNLQRAGSRLNLADGYEDHDQEGKKKDATDLDSQCDPAEQAPEG